MRMPLVYVSGPITADVMGGTRRAIAVGSALLKAGFAPYVPHLSVFWEIAAPKSIPYEQWLELDLEIISRCDAFARLEGESRGADREEAEARRLGLPVFPLNSGPSLLLTAWGEEWRAANARSVIP